MPIPAAVGIAAKAAPYVLGAARLFGRGRRRVNWDELGRYAAGLRPTGYLTAEDYAAGEGVRRRLSGAATEAGANLRLEALRRIRQRGIDIAPASEATLSRIGETEAVGHERAAEGAEEYLGNVRLGREQFEMQKALALLGGRIGEATGQQGRQDIRDATFFNALLELTPSIIGGIGRLSSRGTTGGGGRSYNPATGRFEIPKGGSYNPETGRFEMPEFEEAAL